VIHRVSVWLCERGKWGRGEERREDNRKQEEQLGDEERGKVNCFEV
jgi:hypothetical protein